MKKLIYIALGLLILTFGISSLLYYEYISSPKYSLNQIRESIKNHDFTQFNKLVDTKYIANEFLDKYILDGLNNNTETSEAWPLGELLGKGFSELMKVEIEEELSHKIQKFVEQGYIKKTDDGSKLNYFYLLDKILVFKSVKSVEKDGRIANVRLKFTAKRYDTILEVNVQMRDKGRYWQIFDISNGLKLLENIEKLEIIRTKKLNKESLNKFKNIIQTSSLKKGKRYIDGILEDYYYIEIKNISNKLRVNTHIGFDILDSVGDTVSIFTQYINEDNLDTNEVRKIGIEWGSGFDNFNLKKYRINIVDFYVFINNKTSIEIINKWNDLW